MTSAAIRWQTALAVARSESAETVSEETLSAALVRHRLVGFVSPRQLTPQQDQALNPLRLAERARSMVHVATLAQLTSQAQELGLPWVPFKGVVLQQHLRNSPLGRAHTDMDVWVGEAGLEPARRFLRTQGWKSSVRHTEDLAAVDFQKEGLALDLHRRWLPHRLDRPRVEEVLAPVANHGLSSADHAFLGVLHGAKDLWPRLRTLIDAREAVERFGADAMMERADALCVRQWLDAGFTLVHDLLGRTDWTIHHVPPDELIRFLNARLSSFDVPSPGLRTAGVHAVLRPRHQAWSCMMAHLHQPRFMDAESRWPSVVGRATRWTRRILTK